MSEDTDEAAAEGAAGPAEPVKVGKKKLLIIAAALLVVGGGGGGAAYMMLGSGGQTEEAKQEESASAEPLAFVEVPPMIVNLRSPDGQLRYLKLRFVLVPKDAGGGEKLKTKLPLILDAYQPFLRELRPEDLSGSAAVFRLKEEMLIRATRAVGPDAIRDVLIQDLIQQ